MWMVEIWVPTKGWKLVKRLKNEAVAIKTALEFLPLEVKLTNPHGRTYVSGQLHMSNYDIPSLQQIEKLATGEVEVISRM